MSPEALAVEYKKVFMNLIVIQGLFSGITVGKMSEGSMMSGIKHSLFMAFAGAIAYSVSGFF
jgi:flagellar protein FlaJ